jgi:hypothetical protein
MTNEPTAPAAEAEAPLYVRALRERWLEGLRLADKNRLLFELESLLKGLDRFFNIANLPLANMEQAIAINFVDELAIVLQFIERTIELSGKLLEASKKDDYQFQSYIENKLLGDYERGRWREAVLEQRCPEDSLFILYSVFVNLRELVRVLLSLPTVSYAVFFNTGSLITREIMANRFFNPDRAITFRPEFDKIDNRKIGRTIRAVGDPLLQRQVSIVVLAFHRLLQYLRFVDPQSDSIEVLKSSLLFFALIHSESKYLMEFMEKNLPRALAGVDRPLTKPFLDLCDSLSFQLQMELKKIHAGELINLSKHQKLEAARTAVENSHGIFMNFFQQSIYQLLKLFEPGLMGEEIFPVFISRKRQSVKLREDMAVLQALMNKFEEITETSEAGERLDTFVKYLILQKGLIARMRRDTLMLMRYQDLLEFDKYFQSIEAIAVENLHRRDILDRFKMQSKFFKIFVETTLGHMENRADLRGVPLDPKRVERILKRFIAEYLKL